MTASLTCPRHKYVCIMSSSSRLDRRADLAGRPSYGVHPTISMKLFILVGPSCIWSGSSSKAPSPLLIQTSLCKTLGKVYDTFLLISKLKLGQHSNKTHHTAFTRHLCDALKIKEHIILGLLVHCAILVAIVLVLVLSEYEYYAHHPCPTLSS
jgi:hypothetical protein